MRNLIIATLFLAGNGWSAESNDVLAVMKKVADWQLAHPSSRRSTDWTQGACYAGMMALASLAADPKYHDAMMEMSRTNQWSPRDPEVAEVETAARAAAAGRSTNAARAAYFLYHADEQCVLQTYLELYLKHRDPQMLAPAKDRLDKILADPRDDDLTYTNRGAVAKWSWCDTLFMAPPVWARMTAATGDRMYLDFMNHNWWVTSGYLYDKTEHLYYRDSRFFDKREANGKKVFWCRGNGWVMGGLARVLQFMPADYPDRPKYVAQLKEMSAALVKLQGKDGLWSASLLNPEAYPPDSSGSGYIVYGLAYGVNQKILDRPTYEPPILKGWQGLLKCVDEAGKLGFVQPVGYQPVEFGSTNTDVYGVGAFLLAGSEIYQMLDTSTTTPPMNIEQIIRHYRSSPIRESIGPVAQALAAQSVFVGTEGVTPTQDGKLTERIPFKVAADNQGRLWAYVYTSQTEFSKAFPRGGPFVEMSFASVFKIVDADHRFGGIYLNSASDSGYPIPKPMFDDVRQRLPSLPDRQ